MPNDRGVGIRSPSDPSGGARQCSAAARPWYLCARTRIPGPLRLGTVLRLSSGSGICRGAIRRGLSEGDRRVASLFRPVLSLRRLRGGWRPAGGWASSRPRLSAPSGSEWITGVAIAVANIVWYAVAINYAIDTTLLGLHACDLIAPEASADCASARSPSRARSFFARPSFGSTSRGCLPLEDDRSRRGLDADLRRRSPCSS